MSETSSQLDAARDRLREAVASPYLTVSDAAALARCSSKTIRRAIHAGHLTRIGATTRVLLAESDVRAWVENGPAARSQPPARVRRGRPAPGSVTTLREMDPGLSR